MVTCLSIRIAANVKAFARRGGMLSVAEILKKLTKMARVKTNRVHYDDNGKKHEVSKEKG